MQKGFTLVEIITAIAITTLLLRLCTPCFVDLYQQIKSDSEARLTWHQLSKTRELAITQGQRITFCGLDHEGNCVASNFRQFAIFNDQNRNAKLDANEPSFSEFQLNYDGDIYLNAAQNYIRYKATGSSSQAANILFCPKRFNEKNFKKLTVNLAGRAYLSPNTQKTIPSMIEKCNLLRSST